MPQLRWTLLCIGVLFIVVLAMIERRRQRSQGFMDVRPREREQDKETSSVASPMFRDPALTLPEMRAAREPALPQELPVVEIEDDSLNARRLEVGESLMDPPTLSLPVVDSGPTVARPRTRTVEPTLSDVGSMKPGRTDELAKSIGDLTMPRDLNVPRLDTPAPKKAAESVNLADAESIDDSDERAFNEAVFGGSSLGEDLDLGADDGSGADAAGDAGPVQAAEPEGAERAKPLFTAADVTPVKDPIVDWPPDDQRRVVALRLVAPPPDRLAGRALRLALASEGFVLGKFQIFHKPDDSGRAVLSAASLSKPGTFELETMDSQRYPGLSLFAVLPGPKPPLKAFEDLLATARNLNERLQGALQDEKGGPLTPTRIASLRETLAAEMPS